MEHEDLETISDYNLGLKEGKSPTELQHSMQK